jgi:superfamily II DNA or RNA helicase
MRLWSESEGTALSAKFIRTPTGLFALLINFLHLVQFFLEFQHLDSSEEKTKYLRKHRNELVTRGQCCFPIPKLSRDGGGIDPRAVLWQQQHPDDKICDGCPSCILLSAMNILYKLSSHAALLQVKTPPDQFGAGSGQREKAEKMLKQAQHFLPDYLLSQLPGGYIRESGMMDNHFGLSGKMVVLDKLLRAISKKQGRVLLFSHSTQALDLIQNYIMAVGYSYLRMDGQTSQKRREEIADQFRKGSEFVFLLSTKAMGLGLNLTEVRAVVGLR